MEQGKKEKEIIFAVCLHVGAYGTYDTQKSGRNICQKNTKTKPGKTEKTGVFKVLDWKKKSTGS